MRNVLILLAGLASAGAALAQVDPTHVMITGIGNSNAKPGDFVVTNQTESSNPSTSETTTLEKFVVTGSLLGHDGQATKAPKSGAKSGHRAEAKLSAKDEAPSGSRAGPRS